MAATEVLLAEVALEGGDAPERFAPFRLASVYSEVRLAGSKIARYSGLAWMVCAQGAAAQAAGASSGASPFLFQSKPGRPFRPMPPDTWVKVSRIQLLKFVSGVNEYTVPWELVTVLDPDELAR